MVREIAFAVLLAAPAAAWDSFEINVLVFDYAGSTEALLDEAEQGASALYQDAGLTLRWRDCTSARETERIECGHKLEPGGAYVALRIVSRLTIDPRNSSKNADNVFGYSSGPYATVAVEPLWRISVRTGEAQTRVLACAIAHELGHILLGSESHSRQGLMQRDSLSMLRSVRQGFGFSNAESARLNRYLYAAVRQEGVVSSQ